MFRNPFSIRFRLRLRVPQAVFMERLRGQLMKPSTRGMGWMGPGVFTGDIYSNDSFYLQYEPEGSLVDHYYRSRRGLATRFEGRFERSEDGTPVLHGRLYKANILALLFVLWLVGIAVVALLIKFRSGFLYPLYVALFMAVGWYPIVFLISRLWGKRIFREEVAPIMNWLQQIATYPEGVKDIEFL